jgi:hypothetical protein
MDDVADILLVDAHAEGDGGHHDAAAVLRKRRVRHVALLRVQQAVIKLNAAHASRCQRARRLLHAVASRHVHDDAASFSRRRLGQRNHLAHAGARLGLQEEVGAVEAGERRVRAAQAQAGRDVGAHAGRRRCSQRQEGHARKQLAQRTELAELLTEVVAPLRHAVRLVNRNAADAPAHDDVSWGLRSAARCGAGAPSVQQPLEEGGAQHHGALGRHVEDVDAPRSSVASHRAALFGATPRREASLSHAGAPRPPLAARRDAPVCLRAGQVVGVDAALPQRQHLPRQEGPSRAASAPRRRTAPRARRAWSCISEMSGEMTRHTLLLTSGGIW